MDLVRIFPMVETPLSGKRDFNHIYVVGLIQSILRQFCLIQFQFWFSLSLQCSSSVHVWYGYCSKSAGFCQHSHIVCFSQIQGLVLYSVDKCGSHLRFDFRG